MKLSLQEINEKIRHLFWSRINAKPPLLFLFIGLAGFLWSTEVKAQRQYPDFKLAVSSKGSDYTITFTWNGLNVPNCDKADRAQFFRGGFTDNYEFHKENRFVGNDASQAFAVGPGLIDYWGMKHS
ncbi:MAG: hypothetical protein ACO1OF_06400 [Adhaeribacter sp.]